MRSAARPIPEVSAKVQARLFSKIEKRPDGIWAWKGSRFGKYGSCGFLIGYEPFYVNRLMWVIHMRRTIPDYQIPDNLRVCHRNDVTPELYDCNPENYFLGTDLDNVRDRERKKRGHRPTGKNNGTHTKPETVRRGDDHHARRNPLLMARGERHGNSKLKWVQVHEIRALYATGDYLQRELAVKFGVTVHNIKSVVLWKSWRTDVANAYKDVLVESEKGPVIIPAPSLAD